MSREGRGGQGRAPRSGAREQTICERQVPTRRRHTTTKSALVIAIKLETNANLTAHAADAIFIVGQRAGRLIVDDEVLGVGRRRADVERIGRQHRRARSSVNTPVFSSRMVSSATEKSVMVSVFLAVLSAVLNRKSLAVVAGEPVVATPLLITLGTAEGAQYGLIKSVPVRLMGSADELNSMRMNSTCEAACSV